MSEQLEPELERVARMLAAAGPLPDAPATLRERTLAIPDGEEVIDGTYKSVKNPGLERETFGLGLGVVRVPGMLTFVSSVTPVDEDNVHVRWMFSVPVDAGEQGARFFAKQFTSGVTQDIPIWENKIYRAKPPLTRVDGPILAYRRWFRQFYSDWEPVEES